MRRERLLLTFVVIGVIVGTTCGCDADGPGEVRGVVTDPGTSQVIAGALVWLMQVVEDEEARGFVMVDEKRAVPAVDSGISTETSEDGAFVLEEVPPGEYVLMAMIGRLYVLRTEQSKAVMFELSGGEDLDVGQVSVRP